MDNTTVGQTDLCEIVLDSLGFYIECQVCGWTSNYTASKSTARRWANEHDEDHQDDA